MFIGREQELRTLNQLYASGKFEFAVIYGRRRVGFHPGEKDCIFPLDKFANQSRFTNAPATINHCKFKLAGRIKLI